MIRTQASTEEFLTLTEVGCEFLKFQGEEEAAAL